MTPTPPPTLTDITPPGIDDLEAHILAFDGPPMIIERQDLREIFAYLRSLEAAVVRLKACKRVTVYVEEPGSFY